MWFEFEIREKSDCDALVLKAMGHSETSANLKKRPTIHNKEIPYIFNPHCELCFGCINIFKKKNNLYNLNSKSNEKTKKNMIWKFKSVIAITQISNNSFCPYVNYLILDTTMWIIILKTQN